MEGVFLVSRIFLLCFCAAITTGNFCVVFVENIDVPVIFWEMFADEVQKLSPDVCLCIHAVGWIKPDYACLSVLSTVLCSVSCWFLAFSVG